MDPITSVDDLPGCYMYEGDGRWFYIRGITENDDGIVLNTDTIHYESVPHSVREDAYEEFRATDKPAVIIPGESELESE